MVAIATQLAAISTLISSGNLICNDVSNTTYDEQILKALIVLENDLVTLANSSSVLSTTPMVASGSRDWRVLDKLATVVRMARARGYATGN